MDTKHKLQHNLLSVLIEAKPKWYQSRGFHYGAGTNDTWLPK